jgi:hypothetical protein
MGSTVKHPISSTGVLVISPALVCASSVPARGGMIWPSREPLATSSSRLRWAEVKVRARIDALSAPISLVLVSLVPAPEDRRPVTASCSRLES